MSLQEHPYARTDPYWDCEERRRFFRRVSIGGINECWTWQGNRCHGHANYGLFKGFTGKRNRAHRYAWEKLVGPIPDGLFVLHACDNPPCVNPRHLFLGTQKDNVHDMEQKGRDRRHFESKRILTDAQVEEILTSSASAIALGKKFGVNDCSIYRVRRRGGLRTSDRRSR